MRPGAMSASANLGLIIRPARSDERIDLEALQRRAALALPDYRAELEANPDAIELPSEQIERGQVLVAELEDRIAGFVALDGSEIDGLFVDPELWRQGIGSALIDSAVHEARRRGCSLTVVANPGARLFYEHCGFSVEGEAQTRFGTALRMSR